jgi:hypothetical protein
VNVENQLTAIWTQGSKRQSRCRNLRGVGINAISRSASFGAALFWSLSK